MPFIEPLTLDAWNKEIRDQVEQIIALEAQNAELREALKELADCTEDNLTHRPEKRLERALTKASAILKEK